MFPLVHLCFYLCIISVSIYYIHEKRNYINNQSCNLFFLCRRESCSHSTPPSRTGKPTDAARLHENVSCWISSSPPWTSLPAFDLKVSTHSAEEAVLHKSLGSKQQKFTPQTSLLSQVHTGLHLSKVFPGSVINLFYQHNILDTTTRPPPILFPPESLDKWEFSQYVTSAISNLSSNSKTSFNKI